MAFWSLFHLSLVTRPVCNSNLVLKVNVGVSNLVKINIHCEKSGVKFSLVPVENHDANVIMAL